MSLGVLKNLYNELFEPELPEFKIKAIQVRKNPFFNFILCVLMHYSYFQNLGIGTVDKLFLKFPYAWWSKNTTGFSFLWSDDDREKFIKENKVCKYLILF